MTQNLQQGKLQFVLVILFIVGSFAAAKILHATRDPITRKDVANRSLYVEIIDAHVQEHRINFNLTGVLKARTNVAIVPEVSGRIIAIDERFFAGGKFDANQTLFEIDKRDFIFEVKRLKAQLAAAQTKLDLEKAESKAAIAEWKQLNPDLAIPHLVARKPQLEEAQSNFDSAQAQLALAQLNLERSAFRLPFAGRVLSTSLAKGQYVLAGQNYGESFDITSLEAKSSLKDQQLKWLLAAQNPDITITATHLGEKQHYRGFLKRSASFLDDQTRFANVSFGFHDPVLDLLPGTFLDINIKGSKLSDVMVLPIQTLQKEGNIWLLDEKNQLESITPEIVFANDKEMVIKKVKNGKIRGKIRVVKSHLSGAEFGMKIEVINKGDKASNSK